MKNRLVAVAVLMTFSDRANAAEAVSWGQYMLACMVFALVLAITLSVRNQRVEGRAAKILLAGLYFWGFTFAAMTTLALIYHFSR